MPGHTYWRTITANRKSITKASSSLLDFSSIFPTLGETQARYVNPAARPALASLPHRPLPVAPPLRPFPLPSAPSTHSTKAAAAPFPASFLPGRLSAVASAAHTPPHPYSIPLALGPLPRGRTPDPFRGVSLPAGSLLSQSLHSLTHAHPYPAPGASRSVLSSSHPHPTWPVGLSGALDPVPSARASCRPETRAPLARVPLPTGWPLGVGWGFGVPLEEREGARGLPDFASGGCAALSRGTAGREPHRGQLRSQPVPSPPARSPQARWNFEPCPPAPAAFSLLAAPAHPGPRARTNFAHNVPGQGTENLGEDRTEHVLERVAHGCQAPSEQGPAEGAQVPASPEVVHPPAAASRQQREERGAQGSRQGRKCLWGLVLERRGVESQRHTPRRAGAD